jgi:hypothetical protein
MHSSPLSYFSAVTESASICLAQWEVQKLGLELGPGAPGGHPPGAVSLRCCSFVSENISHADPQIDPIFSLPLHTISSKICSFSDCLEIQHAALGSNTYLQGTYEEAATDEFLLDHPVQRLAGWGKSLGQISAGRIMLSKAMSSVR